MGWASGSIIMNEVIDAVVPVVPDFEARKKIYKPIFDTLRQEDWDTVDESMGIDDAFDAVVKEDDFWAQDEDE